jgi:uncharacterized protein (DUF2252 family)
VMRKAATRSWKHLARERLENSKPTIPLGNRFWPITEVERRDLKSLFVKDHIQRLATMLRSRPNDAVVEFIDAAYWMKGCSSLGKLRYAVLLSVSGEKSSNSEYCLMDVKEAVKPAALRAMHSRIPKEQSERVVSGARHVSPSLGDRMRASQLAGHSVFIRELLPQDLKIEIERLTRSETMKAAHYLAAVIGKAHARQMDATTRASWLADLAKHRSKVLDAPSWLWTSVIELLVTHERSYLEHCRRYALQKDAS